jgi:hypothetical protein
VILHGHGNNAAPSLWKSPAWNILAPLDRYGAKGQGSWWLGEGGDFFVADLLHRLVKQVRRDIGRDAGLYFMGSSMGGYGALLHGLLLGARAVFTSQAQTRLSGTAYTDAMPAIAAVGATGPTADLRRYVRGKKKLPLFLLDFNRYDHADVHYYDEHFVPFVAACDDAGAAYRATIYDVATHQQQRSFADVLRLFEAE